MKIAKRMGFDFRVHRSYEAGFSAGREAMWRDAQKWLEEREIEYGRLVRLWFALGLVAGFLLGFSAARW